MSHLNDRIDIIAAGLREAGVPHECFHDCVSVPVSGGVLEVKFWSDGDDSVQLMPGDSHTHLALLQAESGLDIGGAFAWFASKVRAGEFPIIEETEPDGTVRRTIEQSLQLYLEHLPKGAKYRVLRET